MGRDYGIVARLTLSYDCTVLVLLYLSLNSEKCTVARKRCVVNPLKKCEFCKSEGEAFRFAGADTMNDEGFFRRCCAVILRCILKRSYKRAVLSYPEIDEFTGQMIKKQQVVEQNQDNADAAAEPTAELISKLCSMLYPKGYNTHIAEVFGYYTGRWIYLMDAADDLEKDIKKGSFNPFRNKYNGDIIETMNYCNEVLNMTAAQIAMAYDLLNIGSYKSILDNIIYDGIPQQQKCRLFAKFNADKQKKRKRNKSKKGQIR